MRMKEVESTLQRMAPTALLSRRVHLALVRTRSSLLVYGFIALNEAARPR